MKNTSIVLAFLFFCGGKEISFAQGAKEVVWGVIRQSLPKVDSPLLRQWGFQGHNVVVANASVFYCQLYAGGKKLAVLPPGGIAFDQRLWQNMPYQQIPMAALCYWDSDFSNYAGAAGNIFYLQSYYQQALQWIIRTPEIRSPNGNYFREDAFLGGEAAIGSRYVRLPKESHNGFLGLQVVNNTLFTARVFINGIHVDTIETGDISHQRFENFSPTWQRQANLTIVFEDNGRVVSSYGETLYVQPYGVWARQIILSPEYIWWRY